MTIEIHKLEGPLLILASPGTGKTYRMAQRIKYLVEEAHVDPASISVMTFTVAAAINMRIRISDYKNKETFIPKNLQPSTICTMHSLGHRIITEYAPKLGLPEHIAVAGTDFTRDILMEDAAQLVDSSRDDAKKTSKCRQYGDCHPMDDLKCNICEQYKKILRACGAVDLDDQILLACEILRKDEDICLKYRTRALHLLIDEYQDINAGQFELIKLLIKDNLDGLFVVGDDDQSIYSWRGGSPEFIRSFKDIFGENAKIESLVRSFRCHRNIIEGALAVVKKNDKKRSEKRELIYESPDGPKIKIHNVPSDKREAKIIRRIIEDALPSKNVLVLVPTRRYLPLIVNELRRARIQYAAPEPLPGKGLPIIERLSAWLENENDSLALRECIESMLNSNYLDVPSKQAKTPENKKLREKAFSSVGSLWKHVITEKQSLWKIIESSHNNLEPLKSIYTTLKKLQSIDQKEVPEFLKLATTSLKPWNKRDSLMEEVSGWVNRISEGIGLGSTSMVKIMTLQGAKGLEADVVCVIGLEQGTIPRNDENLDEQSRLMYVSMTRAKSELHLFHSRKRSGDVSFQQVHGPGGSHKLEPSCFVNAIPDDFSEKIFHPAKS